MSDGDKYNADYFLNGQKLGISGYTDYRWLSHLTIPMVQAIVSHCGIRSSDTVLDFGCARGYIVRAFRELGYNAYGYDVSKWALDNCDETVKEYLIGNKSILYAGHFDWVIAKDVLEHIEYANATIDTLMECARIGVFVVVPLSHDGKRYDVPSYEEDCTHIHRRPLQWWVGQMHRPGWSVEARYRVRGVKDNYSQYPGGNGFITARRIEA